MGRYSTLYRLTGGVYTHGCPLIVTAGALLRDDQAGRVLAQLKFRNISDDEVKAVKVSLRCFDVAGEELTPVPSYQYLDLTVARGDSFGDRQAIPVPDAVARSFSAEIISVLLADGSFWQPEPGVSPETLPRPVVLKDTLGTEELAEQYVRETSPLAKYTPVQTDDLWVCSCGAINRDGQKTCIGCGCDRHTVFSAMDRKLLSEHLSAFRENEELNATVEQVQAEARRKLIRKMLMIVIPAVLVIIGIILAVSLILIPSLRYSRALEMLNMQDYAGAKASLEQLGDYKDAKERIVEADYGAARAMMEQSDFDGAKAAFEKLNGYGDAETMMKECDYLKAQQLLISRKYDEANAAFLALNGYSDSAALANEALYLKANDLLDAGDEAAASALFEQLGDYKDCADQLASMHQDRVDRVNRLIRQNKMDEAWAAYAELVDYEPAPLTKDDFVDHQGINMCDFLDENTTGDKFFGAVFHQRLSYEARKDVTVTKRGIRLGDSRLAVLMAYGEPDEQGELITDGGFFVELATDALKEQMLEECTAYIRYSYNNYRIYFYFDVEDELSWIIFSNEDYYCSTPSVSPADETETAE